MSGHTITGIVPNLNEQSLIFSEQSLIFNFNQMLALPQPRLRGSHTLVPSVLSWRPLQHVGNTLLPGEEGEMEENVTPLSKNIMSLESEWGWTPLVHVYKFSVCSCDHLRIYRLTQMLVDLKFVFWSSCITDKLGVYFVCRNETNRMNILSLQLFLYCWASSLGISY